MLPLTLLQEHADQRTAAALAAAQHHRIRRALVDDRRQERDVTALRSVLEAAAETPLDDLARWPEIRQRAAERTARLAEAGRLPSSLVVDTDDAPVVVARDLAVAWRHLVRTSGTFAEPVRPRPGR
jgi:hypothetical protein